MELTSPCQNNKGSQAVKRAMKSTAARHMPPIQMTFVILQLRGHLTHGTLPEKEVRMGKDTISITDNRTGKTYEVPVTDGTIRAMDLRKIKTAPEDFGLMTYDPAFLNTANCRSAITYIDGDKGILLYRGYPIEQLAEESDYLETAYLILFGELPTATQLHQWTQQITNHTMLH